MRPPDSFFQTGDIARVGGEWVLIRTCNDDCGYPLIGIIIHGTPGIGGTIDEGVIEVSPGALSAEDIGKSYFFLRGEYILPFALRDGRLVKYDPKD